MTPLVDSKGISGSYTPPEIPHISRSLAHHYGRRKRYDTDAPAQKQKKNMLFVHILDSGISRSLEKPPSCKVRKEMKIRTNRLKI